MNSFSISIIIPSLNQGEYLNDTLSSVKKQYDNSIQLIIIDGGSTDLATPKVIKKYSSIIDVFISEPDGGQSDAVNKGLSYAKGEYIIWQNSDDFFLPNAFSDFYKIKRNNPGYDIYFGDTKFCDEKGQIFFSRHYSNIDRLIALYGGLICNNQSSFIKREFIDNYKFLDKTFHFAMDRELFLRYYSYGATFFHLETYIGVFRVNHKSKSSSRDKDEKWLREHIRISKMYNLPIPYSIKYKIFFRFAFLDKSLRILFKNPKKFSTSFLHKISAYSPI